MGPLFYSCAEVCEPIELLFGVMSGVTQAFVTERHSCIRWGPRASSGRVDFVVICPHWPNGINGIFCNRNVFDSCIKS